MDHLILRDVIFHTDRGCDFDVLSKRIAGDPDNTLDQNGARDAIFQAGNEGYVDILSDTLPGPKWVKVTKVGWDWNAFQNRIQRGHSLPTLWDHVLEKP